MVSRWCGLRNNRAFFTVAGASVLLLAPRTFRKSSRIWSERSISQRSLSKTRRKSSAACSSSQQIRPAAIATSSPASADTRTAMNLWDGNQLQRNSSTSQAANSSIPVRYPIVWYVRNPLNNLSVIPGQLPIPPEADQPLAEASATRNPGISKIAGCLFREYDGQSRSQIPPLTSRAASHALEAWRWLFL